VNNLRPRLSQKSVFAEVQWGGKRGVPGCSGVPECSGVPVFRCSGVPVFRCSGVLVFWCSWF